VSQQRSIFMALLAVFVATVVLAPGCHNPAAPAGSSNGTNTYLAVLTVSAASNLGGAIQLSVPRTAVHVLRRDKNTILTRALALVAPIVHAQAGATVTGTLVTNIGKVIELTGTYSGGVFSMTGGGYTITATLTGDAAINGTGTAPGDLPAGLVATPPPAAPQPVPANPAGTYNGSFHIDTVQNYSVTHPNQSVPYFTCTVNKAITGTLKLVVTNTTNGHVNGDLSSNWTETPGTTTCGFGFASVSRNTGFDYDGPPTNLQFGLAETGQDGPDHLTRVQGFSGVVSGNTVIGVVSRSFYSTGKNQVGAGPDDVVQGWPTATTAVTLTK